MLILLSDVLKRIATAFLCPTIHELHIFRRSSSVVNTNVTWIVNELKWGKDKNKEKAYEKVKLRRKEWREYLGMKGKERKKYPEDEER